MTKIDISRVSDEHLAMGAALAAEALTALALDDATFDATTIFDMDTLKHAPAIIRARGRLSGWELAKYLEIGHGDPVLEYFMDHFAGALWAIANPPAISGAPLVKAVVAAPRRLRDTIFEKTSSPDAGTWSGEAIVGPRSTAEIMVIEPHNSGGLPSSSPETDVNRVSAPPVGRLRPRRVNLGGGLTETIMVNDPVVDPYDDVDQSPKPAPVPRKR